MCTRYYKNVLYALKCVGEENNIIISIFVELVRFSCTQYYVIIIVINSILHRPRLPYTYDMIIIARCCIDDINFSRAPFPSSYYYCYYYYREPGEMPL